VPLLTDVTVVVPTLNEAPSVGSVVAACREVAAEVIVVDSHSTDGTADVARAAGANMLFDDRRGKGHALRVAIPHVRTAVAVFIDADGSHDPRDIPRVVEPIARGAADHVSASRLIGGSSELHGGFDEFFRLAGSSFITACINWRFGVRLSDSQNGFRAIRTAVLRDLDLRENLTTIEQEMIVQTLRRGYRLMEVPSHEYRRAHGVSHIRVWRVAPRYVYSLALNLFGGRSHPAAPLIQHLPNRPPLETRSQRSSS
jgi:dolichol-phosphate mannosyltransferase